MMYSPDLMGVPAPLLERPGATTMNAMASDTADGGAAMRFEDTEREAIEQFVVIDRLGAAGGAILVIVANGVFIRQPLIWVILPCLLALVLALTVAKRMVSSGEPVHRPLLVVAAGNWAIAAFISFILPFLWPVMVLRVLMPLVLATPYIEKVALLAAIVCAAAMGGVVSVVGLSNDDGGALPDIEDEYELMLVVGALVAHIIPIGLIVWQNNRLQYENLERARNLNAQLIRSQEELAASRRRVVQAGDTERRRIERDLHDGAQQQLVVLGVRLRLLDNQTGDLPEVNEAVQTLIGELDDAVEEVRKLAHGIYPPLLQSRGLVDALRAVARRSPLGVETELDDVGRLDQSIETALYFTALEALTNAAKHAPDSVIDLRLIDNGTSLQLSVSDDGPGFVLDESIKSQGTHNMGDRVAAVGGELAITSSPGAGTTVTAVVPR